MADIRCRLCGEPWDSYGVTHHEDMSKEEAQLFRLGKGCPHCHFGQNTSVLLPVEQEEDAMETFLEDLYENTDSNELEDFLDSLL